MMWPKLSKNSSVKNILVISLTNIGDVLMNCPVLDILRRDFPQAKLAVVVGPKAQSIFKGNRHIEAIVFDKHAGWFSQLQWILTLRARHFDVVIDLRNTAIPFFINARYATWPIVAVNKKSHLVEQHLARLHSLYPFDSPVSPKLSIDVLPADVEYVKGLLLGYIKPGEPFAVIAPLAADSAKTWNPEGFTGVCLRLMDEYGFKVVLVGGQQDKDVLVRINAGLSNRALDLAGKTDLVQVAQLLKSASLAIVHDSGIMHIASYLNIPTIALFGPTNPAESRPWGGRYQVVRRNKICPRCLDRRANLAHNCMSAISVDDVINAYKNL